MIIDQYKGIFVPIVTPFTTDHFAINYELIREHLEFLSHKGITGIILASIEGEFPALSIEERKSLITWVMKFRQHLKVIIHTGTPSLVETIMLSQFACDHDADALLISLPQNYPDASVEGFIAYFCEIIKRVEHPIFLLNTLEYQATLTLIEQIRKFPYFCGMIDYARDWEASQYLIDNFGNLHTIIGNDLFIKRAFEHGVGGVMSSLGNILPDLATGIYHSIQKRVDSSYLQQKLADYVQLCNQFPLQAVLKHIIYLKGFIESSVRPPLLNLNLAQKKLLERELEKHGFFN